MIQVSWDGLRVFGDLEQQGWTPGTLGTPGIVKIGEISKSEYLAINRPGVAGAVL